MTDETKPPEPPPAPTLGERAAKFFGQKHAEDCGEVGETGEHGDLGENAK